MFTAESQPGVLGGIFREGWVSGEGDQSLSSKFAPSSLEFDYLFPGGEKAKSGNALGLRSGRSLRIVKYLTLLD